MARLDAIAADEKYIDRETARKRIPDRPVPGTRLVREWQGVEHAVTVLENGFEYRGRPFKSLSAVANAITGTRWSGCGFRFDPATHSDLISATRSDRIPATHSNPVPATCSDRLPATPWGCIG